MQRVLWSTAMSRVGGRKWLICHGPMQPQCFHTPYPFLNRNTGERLTHTLARHQRQEPLLRTQPPGEMSNFFNLKFSPGFFSTNFQLFTWFACPIPLGPRVSYVHYKRDKNNVRLDMKINRCVTIVQDIPVLVHFYHCVLSAAQSWKRGCQEEML